MRVSWTLLALMTLSLCAAPIAEAKSKKSKKKADTEAPAEPPPEPAPEPAPEENWGASMESDAHHPEPEAEPAPEAGNADQNNAAIEAADEKNEPEPTTQPTWWFGAYLHDTVVPGFMLGLFLQDPPAIANASFGATVQHRNKDGFSWVLGLGYAGYGFEGPLHQKGKPDVDTEWVKSSLGLVHVNAALLWSTQFHPMFGLEYGIGADLGIITGSLTRTEAYKTPTGGYAPCIAPNMPFVPSSDGTTQFCEQPVRNGVPIPGTN
ncbi:MAG TPA: hypothetical protein VHM19_18910, partial [Polyangiales bacterium]|nr:hypothetical protein [Polyangiales bacterium]